MLTDIAQLDTARLAISTGCVRYADLAYLVVTDRKLAKEKVPHSTILSIDGGKVGGIDLHWAVASVAVCHQPQERLIAVGQWGQVRVLGGGENAEEPPIHDGKLDPSHRGPLREVRAVARGRAYAVGTGRQCYLREGPGHWRCIDATAQAADGKPLTDKSFESIDGFSDQEVYAVGWDGEIWGWNGTRWQQFQSPTNVALHKVICAPDGHVYACGKMGVVVKGRGTNWEIVEHTVTEETFWGMAAFEDRIYLSTTHLLYVIDARGLQPFQPAEDPPTSCYHLSAADGVMWSIGFTEVFEMAAHRWTRLL